MPFDELHSPEYRLLSIGMNDAFWSKLVELHESNHELLKKIFDICSRLRFVDQLRYNTDLKSQFYVPLWGENSLGTEIFQYQIDRLKAYLTATCIDVVSKGEKDWSPFDKWLLGELNKDSHTEITNETVDRLSHLGSSKDIIYCLQLWISELIEIYLDEFGIHKNFIRFISEDVPSWLEEWIGINIYLIKGDIDSEDKLYQFHFMETKEKVNYLADYVFRLRNRYTHTVDLFDPHEDKQIKYLRPPFHNYDKHEIVIRKTFTNGDRTKSVEWTTGTTISLSESDIIRLVLIIQIRNKILGIIDDRSSIESYLERQTYSYLGFMFLDEVKLNWESVVKWKVGHPCGCYSRLGRKNTRSLKDHYAKAFIKLYNKRYPERQNQLYPSYINEDPNIHAKYYPEISTVNLLEYLELLNNFNQCIQDKNTEAVTSKSEKDKLISEFIDSPLVGKICSYCECISRDLHYVLDNVFY